MDLSTSVALEVSARGHYLVVMRSIPPVGRSCIRRANKFEEPPAHNGRRFPFWAWRSGAASRRHLVGEFGPVSPTGPVRLPNFDVTGSPGNTILPQHNRRWKIAALHHSPKCRPAKPDALYDRPGAQHLLRGGVFERHALLPLLQENLCNEGGGPEQPWLQNVRIKLF